MRREPDKSSITGRIERDEPDVVDAFLRLVEKGEFRAPDDHGGGSLENIENIRGEIKE